MTSETRYMRSDRATVNLLPAYILGKTQSNATLGAVINTYEGNVNVTQYIGIAVLKRTATGVETQISVGTCVAIASRSTTGIGSATWDCPLTALDPTDTIVLRILADDVTPPAANLNEEVSGNLVQFQTERLGDTQLDAATWTAYYQFVRTYAAGPNETTYRFRWGHPTNNSRITNFSHSTPGSAPVVSAHPGLMTLLGIAALDWKRRERRKRIVAGSLG